MKKITLTAAALATSLMCACSSVSQQGKEAIEQNTASAGNATEKASSTPTQKEGNVAPTQEQQTTAAELLQQPEIATPALVQPLFPTQEAPAALPTTTGSGIPGRSGLRLGKFAPPEEAASTGEAKAITPNSAEQHGLRSPALPTKLPLDVNGQSNNHNGL